MANKVNNHVKRLHRYLPFSPDHDQIYEEYQNSNDSLNLETVAFSYLKKAIKTDAKLVILTGDAGHGKTYICRRLIEMLGFDEDSAREKINQSCDGSAVIKSVKEDVSIAPLRIYKDFSELSIEAASSALEKAIQATSEITVVCANEGRLRAVLDSPGAGEGCRIIRKEFGLSFTDGLSRRNGGLHLLNLNYQSVASKSVDSLVEMALSGWLDARRWSACRTCDSSGGCPILRNQQLLTATVDSNGACAQKNLRRLFATTERLGSVVTIRDMLMSVAYLITGSLTCKQVHQKYRKPIGWQHAYSFYNVIFFPPKEVPISRLARIPVLLQLRKLDPGIRAMRIVDERLLNLQGEVEESGIDTSFTYRLSGNEGLVDAANGIDDIIGNPSNKKERQSESQFTEEVVRSLRRRDFFFDARGEASILGRLGFQHGSDFIEIVGGNVSPARMSALKTLIVAGLHTIQGIQMRSGRTHLHLVDPAFGNATSRAAIIARRIPISSIKLIPLAKSWSIEEGDEEGALSSSVDWLDRRIILRIEDRDAEKADFPLDLMLFDCIARAGAGYVAERFYDHDVRRVANYLSRLAERPNELSTGIDLILNERMHSISIDDGVIQVSGD